MDAFAHCRGQYDAVKDAARVVRALAYDPAAGTTVVPAVMLSGATLPDGRTVVGSNAGTYQPEAWFAFSDGSSRSYGPRDPVTIRAEH
jgi:hypothetical protein